MLLRFLERAAGINTGFDWVAGVLAITVLGAVLWNLRPEPRRASDSVARLTVSLSPSEGLAYGDSDLDIQGGGGSAVAVSPDGTRLAYVGLGGSTGGRELYIRDLAESEGWRVRESEGVRAPFFSPDSQWVGFFAGGLLKKVSVSGGAPTTICDANNARGGSWSEEDLIVFAPSSRAPLSLVSAAGGTAEPLTVLDNEYGETTHRIPMFLPGGDAFLFLAAGNTRQDTRVVVYSLSSGERRVLVEEATLVLQLGADPPDTQDDACNIHWRDSTPPPPRARLVSCGRLFSRVLW